MSEFSLSDLENSKSFFNAVSKKQRSPVGPVKTTGTSGVIRRGLSAPSLADVLQGTTVYRPKGFTMDIYNQVISDTLGYVNAEEGFGFTPNAKLTPYDVVTNEKAGQFGVNGQAAAGATIAGPQNQNVDPAAVGGKTPSGLVFPLAITQSGIKGHSPAWAYNNQNNAHHSYNAADIFAPVGTPVVAAMGGIVHRTKPNNNSNLGGRLSIQGDDGFWYYYAHMIPESLRVANGDRVPTGHFLGEVGNSSNAQGTSPHLHFDISPQENSFSRGYGFAEGPLLNPQPALIEAFNLLDP